MEVQPVHNMSIEGYCNFVVRVSTTATIHLGHDLHSALLGLVGVPVTIDGAFCELSGVVDITHIFSNR